MYIQDSWSSKKNNFTLLRLLAASAVLYCHSYNLLPPSIGGEDPVSVFLLQFWGKSLAATAVDLFFVASGFLVTASYLQRGSLTVFLQARILRIFPALIAATCFCAFVIGPLATSVELSEYFSSPLTWDFLKFNSTLVYGVRFVLPSVFETNPHQWSVNGSLWTLPIELLMYVWVAIIGSCAVLKDRKTFNTIFLVFCLFRTQSMFNIFLLEDPRNLQLMMFFFLGGFLYVNREQIPLSIPAFVGLCLLLKPTSGFLVHSFIKEVAFSYLVLLLALHPRLRLPSIDRFGDVSYGVYIYAFPVQQSIVHFMPGISPISMIALSAAATGILSIASWKCIEKPAMKLKGKNILGRLVTAMDGFPVPMQKGYDKSSQRV